MSIEIVFADEKLKQAFDKLKGSKTEDKQLYELLKRAFEDIEAIHPGLFMCQEVLYQKNTNKNTA